MALFNRCPNNGGFGILHKWKKIQYEFLDHFEGKEFINRYDKYRVCIHCKQYQYSHSQGWSNLSEVESKVLEPMIVLESSTNQLLIERKIEEKK